MFHKKKRPPADNEARHCAPDTDTRTSFASDEKIADELAASSRCCCCGCCGSSGGSR